VQFYRLVEGSRLEPEPPDDDNYWDCSSPDPSKHRTSKSELYYANDFRFAIDNPSEDVQVVYAAYVAEVIGREALGVSSRYGDRSSVSTV
jgi:hypothetical protein